MTGAVTLPLVFMAGVLSFASPCFLPVVPVFVTYLTGAQPTPTFRFAALPARGFVGTGSAQTAAYRARTDAPPSPMSKTRGLANAAVFVAAFSAVFISLWVLVAVVGWAVGDYRGILRVIGGVILILLGLVTAGLLNFQWRSGTNRVGIPAGSGAPTLGRSALMGLGFGAGWSPCIGPVLGVVLGLAVASESAMLGTGLLIVYCLGLGLPFLLVAAGATWLSERLSWFGRHYRVVQWISSGLLILLGLLMITNLMAPLSSFSWLTL